MSDDAAQAEAVAERERKAAEKAALKAAKRAEEEAAAAERKAAESEVRERQEREAEAQQRSAYAATKQRERLRNAFLELPEEERRLIPFTKRVTAKQVLASHKGLRIDQRSLPFPTEVGQVVYEPSLGHNIAFIVIDHGRGVTDVVVAGEVRPEFLHGHVDALLTNDEIKLVEE
jgi:hypothetical protein